MSDGGFGSISSPVPNVPGARGGRGGQALQIIRLPQQLQQVSQTVRVEGQVVQANQDGTVRIETPQGNIDARVRGGKGRSLQPGQRVEVEIPPARVSSRPSSQVAPQVQSHGPVDSRAVSEAAVSRIEGRIVALSNNSNRSDSAAPNQVVPNRAAGQSAQPVDSRQVPQRPIRSGSSQPLPVVPAAGESIATQASGRIPAAPLQTGDIVRLLSVTPAQAQEIASQSINSVRIVNSNLGFFRNAISSLNSVISQSKPQALGFQSVQTPQLSSTPSVQNVSQPLFAQNNPLSTPILIQSPLQQAPIQNIVTRLDNIASITKQSVTQLLKTGQPALTTSVLAASSSIVTPSTPPFTTTAPIHGASRVDVHLVLPSQNSSFVSIRPINVGTQQPVVPAATPIATPLSSSPNAVALPAVVTGITEKGFPLVTTQWPGSRLPQSFILQFPANNLTVGSQLNIIPQSTTPNQQTAIVQTTSFARPGIVNNPLLKGFQWPALDALYQSLITSAPQSAASMARILPNPSSPAQMVAAGMVFIAAVKSGDLNMLFGDKKLDAIQRAGARPLLGQLTQAPAGQGAEQASSSDWRAVPLPMFWDSEIQKITLYTRREDGDGTSDQQDKNGQTRFVFDLSLSRMGDVQIDGLLKDARLDLIIRTENAFSTPMQETIRSAYVSALEQTELSGNVAFQGSRQHWVHVLEAQEQLGVNV